MEVVSRHGEMRKKGVNANEPQQMNEDIAEFNRVGYLFLGEQGATRVEWNLSND